jgi:hypothetical protein
MMPIELGIAFLAGAIIGASLMVLAGILSMEYDNDRDE